ncbi:MAG: SIR2 family protein [Dermatophilaceae bacterium]
MLADDTDLLEQIGRHLASPCQAWLFGAGISKEAGIPLMHALTSRVRALAKSSSPHDNVLNTLFAELPEKAHIEHFLSHLGDYAAIAERTMAGKIRINGEIFNPDDLVKVHRKVVSWIAEIVRWGYKPATASTPEKIGSLQEPAVEIDDHKAFIEALFKTAAAGLDDRRDAIRLFSTNYDTLLEDALALCGITYWDGFSGGAIAFRNFHFGEPEPKIGYRAHVIKLHGSIDWHMGDDGRVWRVRDGDAYPATRGRVLIYPQATKYIATQRDPFAAQFDLLRRTLSTTKDNVLSICGYSFGDEHINQEIEFSMTAPDSRTTMLVFYNESDGLSTCLKNWRLSSWNKRLYVMTEKGLYVGDGGPFCSPQIGKEHDWWTFAGLTRLLNNGAEGYL